MSPSSPKVVRAALLCLLLPSLASADGPSPQPQAALQGFEVMLRPSFTHGPSNSPVQYQASPDLKVIGDPGALLQGAAPYGPGLAGELSLGYRFGPLISLGLRGGFGITTASTLSDGSTGLTRSAWDAGLYVRIYPLARTVPLRRYLDPWVSVGAAYLRDTQDFQRQATTSAGTTTSADWTIQDHAIAASVSLGVDYRLSPMFSIGPSFEYMLAIPFAGCVLQAASGYSTNQFCSSASPDNLVIHASTFSAWSIGLDARLTFGR